MGRHLRYLPSAVISAVVFGLAACVPPPPPIIPKPPPVFRIPSVVATEVCQHHVLPGFRFTAPLTERGLYAWEWQLSNGAWIRSSPFWYEPGQTLTIETNRPFHVVWAPTTLPTETWRVVSPDYVPVPAALCPDY